MSDNFTQSAQSAQAFEIEKAERQKVEAKLSSVLGQAVDSVSQEDLLSYLNKVEKENKHLKRANSKLKNVVRRKNKEVAELTSNHDNGKKAKHKNKKKHYKNGERGSKFNG